MVGIVWTYARCNGLKNAAASIGRGSSFTFDFQPYSPFLSECGNYFTT